MAAVQGDIYRATIEYHTFGVTMMSTLHFRMTVSKTDGEMVNELQTLAQHIRTRWEQGYIPSTHENVTYRQLSLGLVFGIGDLHQLTVPWDLPGIQVGGDILPTLVALPIHWLTAVGGRRNRGRLHWGPLTEDFQDSGLLTPSGIVQRDSVVNSTLGLRDLTFTSFHWCVFSRLGSQQSFLADPQNWPANSAFLNRKITQALVGSVLGTMYSRKIGVGI